MKSGDFLRRAGLCLLAAACSSVAAGVAAAQQPSAPAAAASDAAPYIDASSGSSAIDVVRRAVASNRSLAAARLDIERAAARVRQAELFPNPTLDLEHTTGRLTGAPDERESTIGVSWPLDVGGKRRSRVDLARAELAAARARFGDRQRLLVADVLAAYVDALAAVRELDATASLNALDIETERFIEARVKEGDAAPLELQLLRVEVDRLRARRELLKGRADAAIVRLKAFAGIPATEQVRLRESFTTSESIDALTADDAMTRALASRPDVSAARADEQAAEANVIFAKAQATPDVTPFGRVSSASSAFDDTPIGKLSDRSTTIGFGVSITLPFFNRNQGARAEADVALRQAHEQRAAIENTARAEVESALRRFRSSGDALAIFERGVIERSTENVKTLRAAYRLGEFRITDVLNEQRRFVDSQREYTDMLAEHYRAQAELQLAIGGFSIEGVTK